MKKQRNKPRGLQRRKAIAGYQFISPFIIGFLLFMVQPFFQSLYMSFSKVEIGAGGFTMKLNGFTNYIRAFTVDTEFTRLLVEEVGRMTANTLAIMVFSFFVALILNQKFKGRALVRAIFFLPVILSSGVILGIEYDNALLSGIQDVIQQSTQFANVSDVVGDILEAFGLADALVAQVYVLVDSIYDIAISSGIQIIIFLSGLQTVPEAMYEAAAIEGCTAWESLWKITFPMVSSLFLVNWVYTIVDFFMRSDNEVMKKIQATMIINLQYDFASAMAWVYFGVVIVIIGVSSLIISKAVYYYD